jgi:tetratricopeptide (TPR) repeat protein
MTKTAPTPAEYESIKGLADRKYADGDYEGARLLYQDVLPSTPSHLQGHIHDGIGRTLLQMGRYEEAEQELRQVLDRGLETPRTLMNLALALYRQGRAEEAIPLYRRVTGEYRDVEPALTRRAETALSLLGAENPAEPLE